MLSFRFILSLCIQIAKHPFGRDLREILFYQKAIPIQLNYPAKEIYNKSRYLVARVYHKTGKKEAEQAQLLKIIRDKGNDVYTSYAYRFLSRNEKNKGDLSKAIYYLQSGLSNTALCEDIEIANAFRTDIVYIYAEKYKTNIVVDPKDLAIVKCNSSKLRLSSTKIVLITSSFVSKITRILYIKGFNFSATKVQYFMRIFV